MNNTDTSEQLADANTIYRISSSSSSDESAFPSDTASSNDAGSQQRVSTIREDVKQDGASGDVTRNEEETTKASGTDNVSEYEEETTKASGADNVSENEEETKTTLFWKGINMKAVHVIYVMPFFATIATRLPLIYFAIYLVEDLDVSLLSVGWFVAAYQAARALTIFADMFYPKAAHLFGTTAGLLGFLALLIKKEHDQLGIFAACNIVVGLAESGAAVQVYAKHEFATDMNSLRYALRTQSAVNGVAVIFGFLFGGVMFQAFGVAGVAGTGVLALGAELLSLVMYIISDHGNDCSSSDKNEGMDTEFPNPNQSDNEVESQPSNTLSSTQNQTLLRSAISNGTVPDALLNKYSASTEIARNDIIFVVAAAFTIESVTVGYIFSIGPLFIKTEFDKDEGAIGLLFSAASLWGTVLTLFFASTKGQAFCRKHLPSPYNLYAFLCTIAAFMIITSVPLFAVHVISILFVVGGNELFLTALTEIQGTITTQQHYAVLGPMAQLVRRFLYIVAAITGPVLFDVYTRLPYLLSGGCSVMISLVVIYKIENQRRMNIEKLARVLSRNRDTSRVRGPSRFSFATLEVLSRMGSLANLQPLPDNVHILSRGKKSADLFAVHEEDDEEDADEIEEVDDSTSNHGTVPNIFLTIEEDPEEILESQ